MKKFHLVILLYILTLFLYTPCFGAWIWTPETGKWINPKSAVKDTAQEQFKWAMEFYTSKEYKRAITEFDKLIKFYPNSQEAPQAQYYVGRCYEAIEEFYHAYLSYQKVIETYPYAKNRDEIIKREYDIGMLFYKGQKSKILGVALLPAVDKAIEIFEQVVKNSPYGEYADDAQFMIGQAYKKNSRFAEATMAFQKLLEEYPQSKLKEKADYEIAQCAYLASLGPYYDQETTDIAIERFKKILEENKNKSFLEVAKDSLKKLNNQKAESFYQTARFYERLGHNRSAAIYYKEIVDKYPDSTFAKDALAKYMEIEKSISKD